MSGTVDWDVAVSTAKALVRPGPALTLHEAHDVVAELRAMVPEAETHVAEFTGLVIPDAHVPVAVVDRIGWVRANVDGFQVLLDPLVAKLVERRGPPKGAVRAVGSRVTGV